MFLHTTFNVLLAVWVFKEDTISVRGVEVLPTPNPGFGGKGTGILPIDKLSNDPVNEYTESGILPVVNQEFGVIDREKAPSDKHLVDPGFGVIGDGILPVDTHLVDQGFMDKGFGIPTPSVIDSGFGAKGVDIFPIDKPLTDPAYDMAVGIIPKPVADPAFDVVPKEKPITDHGFGGGSGILPLDKPNIEHGISKSDVCPRRVCPRIFIPEECRFPQFFNHNGHRCPDCDIDKCQTSGLLKFPEDECPPQPCPRIFIPPKCRTPQFFMYNGYRCPSCDINICRNRRGLLARGGDDDALDRNAWRDFANKSRGRNSGRVKGRLGRRNFVRKMGKRNFGDDFGRRRNRNKSVFGEGRRKLRNRALKKKMKLQRKRSD